MRLFDFWKFRRLRKASQRRHQDRLDVRHIGVHRHQVLRNVRIDDAPRLAIHMGFLQQRHAEAIDDATDQLAVRGFCVHHPPAIERTNETAYPQLANIRIETNLDELRAE